MGCFVLSGKHTFSEEQEEMHHECSSGINGDRVTVAPDGMSQTWSDKLRAGRQSLCGGDTASSTPRGGGVAARNSE